MPKTQTIIAADADDLAFRAAELFKAAARAHVDQRGRFVVALSGGSTPRGRHWLLASPPALTELPWEHTHLFWVDERCVPASDPESNLGKAWRDLLQVLPLPRENIHFVRGDFPPEEAAEENQREIRIEELCQLGDRLSPLGLVGSILCSIATSILSKPLYRSPLLAAAARLPLPLPHFHASLRPQPPALVFWEPSEKRLQTDGGAGVSTVTHPFTLIVSLYAESEDASINSQQLCAGCYAHPYWGSGLVLNIKGRADAEFFWLEQWINHVARGLFHQGTPLIFRTEA